MAARSDFFVDAAIGPRRSYGVLACPNCAGLVVVEYVHLKNGSTGEISSFPRTERLRIRHLPDAVERFFDQAQRALEAGLPDSAAVSLRRTLEAACAARGHAMRNLVQSIESLVSGGLITHEFTPAITHVRKIGNLGAHATDEELTAAEVTLTMRFTEQVLRNLFEIPGEVTELISGQELLLLDVG